MSGRVVTRFVAAALFVGMATGGCASGGPSPAAGAPAAPLPDAVPSVDERFTADIPAELRVREPMDARGADPCRLLSRDQIVDFGLDPDTARVNPARYGPGCAWRYRDGSTLAGVGLTTDPAASKLPDIFRLRDGYEVLEILQINGHPALRADRARSGQCELNVALADDQIVTINAYADGRVLPDPCAPARRMAELIIANLTARP